MSWIRNETDKDPYNANISPGTTTPSASSHSSSPPTSSSSGAMVNIGKSIRIVGELSGNEDLVIEGTVEGKIDLKDHKVTIGAHANIHAEVFAKAAVVVGKMVGNLTTTDRVEIAATGSMNGDITSPRVILADGAQFKGSVDMDTQTATAAPARAAAKPAQPAQAQPAVETQKMRTESGAM